MKPFESDRKSLWQKALPPPGSKEVNTFLPQAESKYILLLHYHNQLLIPYLHSWTEVPLVLFQLDMAVFSIRINLLCRLLPKSQEDFFAGVVCLKLRFLEASFKTK